MVAVILNVLYITRSDMQTCWSLLNTSVSTIRPDCGVLQQAQQMLWQEKAAHARQAQVPGSEQASVQPHVTHTHPPQDSTQDYACDDPDDDASSELQHCVLVP